MTAALFLSGIADAIAGISITGVTVKDRDQISASWIGTPNVLYPNPDGWLTDFTIQFDSLLQGADAPMTIGYTLHYRFLGVQVGDLAAMPVAYSALVDKVIAICNALIAVPGPYSGRVQMVVSDPQLGPREDPAGNQYYGADIALQIQEMQN
jgi:hypothetical protein